MLEKENSLLRERSGYVTYNDKLISFLYELMRDHIPPGVIEEICCNSINNCDTIYTNGYLAKYAEDLATRLNGKI